MRKPRILTLGLGLVLFLLFVLFSYIIHKDLFTQLDFDTTVRLQDHISRRFDTFFSTFSLVGSFEIISLILVALFVIKRKWGMFYAIFSYVALHFLELFGKTYVDHPGPPYLFSRYDIFFTFPSSYVQPGSSYPSGHMARTAFSAVLLISFIVGSKRLNFFQKSILISLILIFVVIMFISRIYLGEHWTSDVIGGAILGAAMGVLSASFLPVF